MTHFLPSYFVKPWQVFIDRIKKKRTREASNEFMPLPQAFRKSIRQDDRFIVSYPRSGSRWICVCLADIANQLLAKPATAMYLKQFYREVGANDFTRLDCVNAAPDAYRAPRSSFDIENIMAPVFKSHNLTQLSNNKIVYIFRNPLYVFVSYYHFVVSHEPDHWGAQCSIDEFCLSNVVPWCTHVKQAIDRYARTPGDICFVQYGEQHPLNCRQIERVASFLGLNCTDEMIENAHMNMGTFLGQLNSDSRPRHKRGCNQDIDQHLSKKTIDTIRMHTLDIMEQAKRIACDQLAP